jgi:O-antigen/teichoic acid export membrane protein
MSSDRLKGWQSFAAGVIWNVTGAVFNQGSTFFLGLIVANALGRVQYGIYGFLQGTILLFVNIGPLAMGFVATKFVAEYRMRDKERTGRVIAACIALAVITGSVVAAVAVLLAPSIAAKVLHAPGGATLIRLCAPAILFLVVSVPCNGILAGFGNFRNSALGGVASGLVYIVLGAVAALRFSLEAVFVSIGISAFVQCVVLFILVLREAKRQGVPIGWAGLSSIGAERRNLLHVALPAALTGFSSLPALWLSTASLTLRPGGIAALALFTAANSIRQLVLFVPYLVNNVGFSFLSKHGGLADPRGFRRAFWMNVTAVVAVTSVAAAAIIAGGPYVLRLFGRDFAEGAPVLIVLVASTIPEALALAAYQIVQTRGEMWTSFIAVALPRDFALVTLAILLTRQHGALGLAYAFMISILIALSSNLLLVRRFGIRPNAAGMAAPA